MEKKTAGPAEKAGPIFLKQAQNPESGLFWITIPHIIFVLQIFEEPFFGLLKSRRRGSKKGY